MLRLLAVTLLGGCFTIGLSVVPREYRLSPRKEAAVVIGAGLALAALSMMSKPATDCVETGDPAEPGELDFPSPCLEIDGRYIFAGIGVVDVISGVAQLVTNDYPVIK